MRHLQFKQWMILALTMMLISCSSDPELKPFTSDGCSLFPDASLITGNDWCSCCFTHDLAYWRGGTKPERETADQALHNCIIEKTGNKALAKLMHEGVKFGGSPYFYNWYRWGYGWSYDRKYQTLTETETLLANQLEKEYVNSIKDMQVCESF